MDPHSTFVRLRTQYPGVFIDVVGAYDYVPVADAKIRQVKEMYRAVKAGLDWKLPKSRVSDLLLYCVSRLNLRRTSALQGVMSPSFLYTGMKPVYDRVFELPFGDYVEVYDGKTNTSRERSLACIALYSVGTRLEAGCSGTWRPRSMCTGRIGLRW